MRYTILRLLPEAALLALLAGCTGYAPPPLASINCEQQDQTGGGDWAYLQCVREESRGVVQPAASTAPAAQAAAGAAPASH